MFTSARRQGLLNQIPGSIQTALPPPFLEHNQLRQNQIVRRRQFEAERSLRRGFNGRTLYLRRFGTTFDGNRAWESHEDDGTGVRGSFYHHIAAVIMNDLADDRQTQSGAIGLS